ncbi:MAG: nucleotidyltransferase family protein [Bacteroidales bacterium]|nr:nucleotidyltransferase family protein [Bacteroidales bacterium]
MIDFKNHIEQKFTDELKLLIFLSQGDLNDISFLGNLDKIDWDEFVELTIKHRLVSHVLQHSEFLAEKFPIPTYEKLIDTRLKHSKTSLNYAIHAIRIFQEFKEKSIPHIFFKGPLLSLELYNDIGYRNFGDIDVLVEKKDAEKAKNLLEDLGFTCIYPKIKLTEKQKEVNYSISHHYQFKHPVQTIHIELHWNITNPKTFFGIESKDIISNSINLKVSNYELPYISKIENIVFQAAHGSIHQWYRLFWIKDFSKLLTIVHSEDLKKAYDLSKKLKLQNCFIQACLLSNLLYKTEVPDFENFKIKKNLNKIPLSSITGKDLSKQGLKGKIKFVLYRIRLKPDFNYYFELIYRLRTHLSDWELIKLPKNLFFLYYALRPFLLIYKFLFRK